MAARRDVFRNGREVLLVGEPAGVQDRAVADAGRFLSKSFKLTGSELALRISLNNILGENYEIVDNYPMPGTNLIARLEYSF